MSRLSVAFERTSMRRSSSIGCRSIVGPRMSIYVPSVITVTDPHRKRVSVRIEEIHYESNPSYLHLNGSINDQGAVSVDINCFKPVPHLHMSLEAKAVRFLGSQDITIMNRTIDYCRGRHKNERKEQLWQLLINLVDVNGNITKSCPFQPGFYCVHDFMISELDVPNFVPHAKFKVFYQVFTENDIGDLDWVAKFDCQGSIGKSGKKAPKFTVKPKTTRI